MFAIARRHATRDDLAAHVPRGSKARGIFELGDGFPVNDHRAWRHFVKFAT